MAVTSAAGFIALLDDKIPDVKTFALKRLNEIVDEFWAEISEYVSKIEILQEDPAFKSRALASLLASKVYYHLGEYDDALHYALCAGESLDFNCKSEYLETILSKCIDKYTSLRLNQDAVECGEKLALREDTRQWNSTESETFKRMEDIVNRMFEKSLSGKQFKHVVGIAIETRRFDMFEQAIVEAEKQDEMLKYAFRVVLMLTDSAHMRDRLLKILVKIYTQRAAPVDSVNLCQCLVLLNEPETTATTLEKLLCQSEESALLAYQIAFDLYENSTQHFLLRVQTSLKSSIRLGKLCASIDQDQKPAPAKEATSTDSETTTIEQQPAITLSTEEQTLKVRLQHLLTILPGDKVIEMHLQLLIRNNKADLKLLDKIKDDVRNTIMHNATVIANGFLHCGTTSDQFLRNHLTWLGKAVNWAKFTATATLGVIHRGHEKDVLKLMSAYLPKDAAGSGGSIYTEGGGLYALGLIHAGHGTKILDYLLTQCKEATAEPVRHGACLGLGLAAMGTGREDVYDQIKMHLFQDDAITGEAAGIGMGLVMLASGSPKAIEDLLGYAKDTSHEKIIRGISLGIALVMYGKQEEADELIDTLSKDTDPILRWCGMATIAMAYCGTGSNKAVRILLHAAVSDTNDDVRRWALTAIGFILFKKPDQVPSLVSLLAESYHPHVRYGAAMAVGIACAGTAQKDAIVLLDTLIDSTVNFVRQGALVAQAMVLMQQNAVTCPKSTEFREKCLKIIGDRHEDSMVKFGAILARGIIDAGGCNMTISLQTRTGNASMNTAVGLLVFQNFWFWYPLANFISMAFQPTALIGLNKDLQMPKMTFVSNAKPSTFAYPPPLPAEKEKKKEKVATAILSITAKQKKKELEKKSAETAVAKKQPSTSAPAEGKEEKVAEPVKPKEVKEPSFSHLENPARIMRPQQRVLSLPADCRYRPLKPITQGGFVVFIDKRPDQKEEIVERVEGHGPVTKAETETAGAGGVAGSGAGTSQAGSESKEPCPVNVHATTLGAFVRHKIRGNAADLYRSVIQGVELDDEDVNLNLRNVDMDLSDTDDDDSGDDDLDELDLENLVEDEEEDEEMLSEDIETMEEEEEDAGSTVEETAGEGSVIAATPAGSSARRGGNKAGGTPSAPSKAGKRSKRLKSKSKTQVVPPKPFEYHSEDEDPASDSKKMEDDSQDRAPTPTPDNNTTK